MRPDPGKDGFKAFASQSSGTPVIATAMVAGNQYSPIRQVVDEIVAERQVFWLESVCPEQRLMGNGTKDDDHFQARHGGQFGFQVRIALTNFRCRWLVGRWQAAHGIGNAAVAQLHYGIRPVVGSKRLRAAGKTKTMQRRVKQLAGHVAGKWTTGSIGPFFARSEADDEQFGVQGTEGRHGQSMPFRIALTNGGQVFGQP